MDTKHYANVIPELRSKLLLSQKKIKQMDLTVLILISGLDGVGKGDVLHLLNEWMDPRFLKTNAYGKPTDEEQQRPKFWRYWRTLPAKGSMGVYVGSWYSQPILEQVQGKLSEGQFSDDLMAIRQFEHQLFADGALIIKCWLHLKKPALKKRLQSLESHLETRWKVTKQDKEHLKLYDEYSRVADKVLKATNSNDVPWLIIDDSDIRNSGLTIGQHIVDRVDRHIELIQSASSKIKLEDKLISLQKNVLDSLDLGLEIKKREYHSLLAKYQGKLAKLSRQAYEKKQSSILVFEGWDAAGKGGAIRRLTHAMDARNYSVIPIAAPTEEERRYHYLWRFWRHLPSAGKVTIYDRSWYGRVLVERVEGFASEQEWKRAYSEIVNFEESLLDFGMLLLKFWIHIDKDEQLKRFKERENIVYKMHKITEEDYRNREKWEDYKVAVNDMVIKTSQRNNNWIIVEGSDKKYARIKVLKAYCLGLEKLLDGERS